MHKIEIVRKARGGNIDQNIRGYYTLKIQNTHRFVQNKRKSGGGK